MKYKGKVVALQTALLKFGIGGKLLQVNFSIGDQVKKGQLVASLDKTETQAYLDRALKLYDRQRAEFDEKQKLNLSDYDKRKSQDELDITIKNVELAKADLEKTNLYSSINGIIYRQDSANPGDNITPAGFTLSVYNPNSLSFEIQVGETDLYKLAVEQVTTIRLTAFTDRNFFGKIKTIGYSTEKDGLFWVIIEMDDTKELKPGLTGEVVIN